MNRYCLITPLGELHNIEADSVSYNPNTDQLEFVKGGKEVGVFRNWQGWYVLEVLSGVYEGTVMPGSATMVLQDRTDVRDLPTGRE